MQSSSTLTIRNMILDDLLHVYGWSIEEGWNIGRYDHDVFYATDPQGFFIAEVDGEPVGAVSGVAYGNAFGFIGMYIVRPEYRGKGYGISLFRTAMDYLGDRCVGLDGVISQQDNYRQSGFQLEYRNIRYQWTAPEVVAGDMPIVDAAEVTAEELVAYDASHFPAARETFIRNWIQEPESVSRVWLENGRIAGFGMIRRFHSGCCIGPLYADSPEIAENLLLVLCGHRTGETVYLDVPEANPAAEAMAHRHGLKQVFETARMYRGTPPKLPLSEIFGVTSFELG